MASRIYRETFDDGPGGWLAWDGEGAQRLEIRDGAAISRGPWWIDTNHAPPGAGYLHLLFCLHTSHAYGYPQRFAEITGANRFVEGGFPSDFTNARLTARLKGDLNARGAELVLLAQAKVGSIWLNHVLMAQPFRVTPDWSEQTITLAPEPAQWTCLGSRHDRLDFYGWGDIADVLRDLNGDIIFVLHPLDVVPAAPLSGDPHRLKAGKDYPVDAARLPEGFVMMDEVRIEFPG